MSGLTVACGNPNRNDVEAMMQVITYRGPYASAIHEGNQIILAQNYLQADNAIINEDMKIPVRSPNNPNLMICYDGQMGDWATWLATTTYPTGLSEKSACCLLFTRNMARKCSNT